MATLADDSGLTPAELAAWRGMLRVQNALLREMHAELAATHGLALRSFEVLLVLEEAPRHRLRMSDLSRSVLLSPSGVSRLVDRLEREGLARRERCSDDARGYWAVLTVAGGRRLGEAQVTHLASVRRLFLERFDSADLARLAQYWERVVPGATNPQALPSATLRHITVSTTAVTKT
jgi:DNA-binding MarR family transcriptional regulator